MTERPFRRRPTCVCGRKKWGHRFDASTGKRTIVCKFCGHESETLWEYVPRVVVPRVIDQLREHHHPHTTEEGATIICPSCASDFLHKCHGGTMVCLDCLTEFDDPSNPEAGWKTDRTSFNAPPVMYRTADDKLMLLERRLIYQKRTTEVTDNGTGVEGQKTESPDTGG